jgi:nitrogen fixation/metabolism regulation signal transduction histidine kinase
MTSRPADRADEAAVLVADMRAAVEDATRQLDALNDELEARRTAVDDLEALADLLLDLCDVPLVVVDGRRRVVALSREAADRLEGAAVGKPLTSLAALVDDAIDQAPTDDATGADPGQADAVGDGATVLRLPGGGAVLVLRGP